MDHLPIFVSVRDAPVLVVGGGEVAARKCAALVRVGACITVVAPELCATLAQAGMAASVRTQQRSFEPADLEGVRLVFAATDDQALNTRVAALCHARGTLVNVVDEPALCSFIMPSIIDRDPVQVAVSTGGASPVLARLLRARLETLIPASYGALAGLMQSYRERVRARITDGVQRRRFWERVLQGDVAELMFAGRAKEASRALDQALDAAAVPAADPIGEVYLVGSGPGDPDLLTFRALRLMQQADDVVHDRLVAPAILDLVRRDARRHDVGKERDRHTLPQQEINHLLVTLARSGRRVLRLKGGDPLLFGRGGEEIETLAAEGIPFQIVPGITAATGCAAYAGIPLTHRDHAQSCVFVTGHSRDGGLDVDWAALARPRQTVVVYMGVQTLPALCAGLITAGLSADTPAALVLRGTTAAQCTLTGTLHSLPEQARALDPTPPGLVIVGEVVTLRGRLAWFEETAPVRPGF